MLCNTTWHARTQLDVNFKRLRPGKFSFCKTNNERFALLWDAGAIQIALHNPTLYIIRYCILKVVLFF